MNKPVIVVCVLLIIFTSFIFVRDVFICCGLSWSCCAITDWPYASWTMAMNIKDIVIQDSGSSSLQVRFCTPNRAVAEHSFAASGDPPWLSRFFCLVWNERIVFQLYYSTSSLTTSYSQIQQDYSPRRRFQTQASVILPTSYPLAQYHFSVVPSRSFFFVCMLHVMVVASSHQND